MAMMSMNGAGGKKAVDHEIPLIPFIDLLLCCVMFLLVTAVWNQVASMQVNQQLPGPADDAPPVDTTEALILSVTDGGFVLASTAGDRVEIPSHDGNYDVVTLSERLEERRRLSPNVQMVTVSPDDGIRFESVVAAMDIVHGAGYASVNLSDGATL